MYFFGVKADIETLRHTKRYAKGAEEAKMCFNIIADSYGYNHRQIKYYGKLLPRKIKDVNPYLEKITIINANIKWDRQFKNLRSEILKGSAILK